MERSTRGGDVWRDGVNADSDGAGSQSFHFNVGDRTLLFFFITGGRVPSYLGSSGGFCRRVVIAATGFNGQGINPNISIALGGIIACGLVYTVISWWVMKIRYALD